MGQNLDNCDFNSSKIIWIYLLNNLCMKVLNRKLHHPVEFMLIISQEHRIDAEIWTVLGYYPYLQSGTLQTNIPPSQVLKLHTV